MKIPPPVVIFVRPQAAGNIGALARTMSNFGCTELRLVGEDPAKGRSPDEPFLTMDWALAKKGEPILKAAKWYPRLEEALEGLHSVMGSSGREVEFERGYARPMVPPQEAFYTVAESYQKAQKEKAEFKWAFVLGPEDDGLNGQEASLCQKLIKISTVDESPSINIAQAAGLVFYHWHLVNLGQAKLETREETGPFISSDREHRLRSTEPGRALWATEDQKEQFLDYVMNTVSMTQFLKYPDIESVRSRVRRWLQAGNIPLGELLFAFEIVYHLRAWGSGKFEPRDFLKKKP